MTKKNDSTRKAGFVAAQPSTVTAAEWLQMERAFNVAGHKHHDLDAYWTLHDKMLSTPAPNWEAVAFKAALVARMAPGLPDPDDGEERAHASSQTPEGRAIVALHDAALAVVHGGSPARVDEELANLAKALGLIDPTNRANVATIAAAEAEVRRGEMNPAEINKALLAIHFDATALSKAKPAPAPVDGRSLSERLAESRRLRDMAEDLPFNEDAEDGWEGTPLKREADALEMEVDVAPCTSREDAVAKIEAVLDALMRKDGDLEDASGSEARSLRSVVAFLKESSPRDLISLTSSAAAARAATGWRRMFQDGNDPNSPAAADAARALARTEDKLIASRSAVPEGVIFKLRSALFAAEPDFNDDGFPDPVDLQAVFGPWAASETADRETRLVASAILDLAAMAQPKRSPPTDTIAQRIRADLARTLSEPDRLSTAGASDDAVSAAYENLSTVSDEAANLPCTSPAAAATKLAYVLSLIARGGGSTWSQQADVRAIEEVVAYLDGCGPTDTRNSWLARHLGEYRRLWAENEADCDRRADAGGDDADNPALVKQALRHFRVVVGAPCASLGDAVAKLDLAVERFGEVSESGEPNAFLDAWAHTLVRDAYAYLTHGFDPFAAVAYLDGLGCKVQFPFFFALDGMKTEAMEFVAALTEAQQEAAYTAAAFDAAAHVDEYLSLGGSFALSWINDGEALGTIYPWEPTPRSRELETETVHPIRRDAVVRELHRRGYPVLGKPVAPPKGAGQ